MHDDSARALLRALRAPTAYADHEGEVITIKGPLATVAGLRGAAAGELVMVGEGVWGLVAELRTEHTIVALLDAPEAVRSGASVSLRGAPTLSVDDLCGRVIDPLGRPLDGGCAPGGRRVALRADTRQRWGESPAPGIFTGLPLVDTLGPFREGRSHALLGPTGTGRSAFTDDLIAACVGAGMRYVLVTTTREASEGARRVALLRARGLLPHGVVVAASAGQPAPRVVLAPRAGAAIARAWFARGERVALLWDEVTPWAEATATCAAALGQPFDREGVPYCIARELDAVLACAASTFASPDSFAVAASLTVVVVGGERSSPSSRSLGAFADGCWVTDASLRARGVYPAIDPSRCTMPSGGADSRYAYLGRALDRNLVNGLRRGRGRSGAIPSEVVPWLTALSVAPGAPRDALASFALSALVSAARVGAGGSLDADELQARIDALRPQLRPLLDANDRTTWPVALQVAKASAREPVAPAADAPSPRGPYR